MIIVAFEGGLRVCEIIELWNEIQTEMVYKWPSDR